ncbi:hypothetical protein NKR19_g10413 [Coniochaeta hoffmannii]|uniref:Uncharacterized protein n=1 Tax=Coniochaeta hoffmannii TaxID=91930 RepID=A0AA38VI33_9PEZI|nr:hypothetical protein NKR19_g10413 [Coniochaeta hoffmannii]
MELKLEKSFAEYGEQQQKTFSQFYPRTLFLVIGFSGLLVGSTFVATFTDAIRLDNEIKRRAILQTGVFEATQKMAQKAQEATATGGNKV